MISTERCSFQRVSEQGRHLGEAAAVTEAGEFVRGLLSCSRRHHCRDADCCVIFGAGLLADLEKQHGA